MRRHLCLFVIAFLLLSCATTQIHPIRTGFQFEEDERRLWNRVREERQQLDTSGFLYEDPDLESYLITIAQKLAPAEVVGTLSFRVKIIKSPLLNAFAYPDGTIYIHTGMLARMENEAQLATLLGHEMSHSIYRHAVRQFRTIKNTTAFLEALRITAAGAGAVFGIPGGADLVVLLGAVGGLAAVTGYSRDLELQADEEGLRLVVMAGYDPKESPAIFQLLKKELEEEKVTEPFFFGTHPRLQERIDNYTNLLLVRYAREAQETRQKNTEEFLRKTQKLILENALLDLRIGRFNSARAGIDKFLRLDPESPQAYYYLGEVYRQKGDSEESIKAYRQALLLNPSYPEPHRGLGTLYYKKRMRKEAQTEFETYLSFAPDAADRMFIEEYLKDLKGEGQ